MTTTIVAQNGAGSTSPDHILGYTADREPRNLVHDLIGGGIAFSLIKPRPRSGRLELDYASETAAMQCLALHGEETLFDLTTDELGGIDMTYVLDRVLTIELQTQTDRWTVSVGFQEA